MKKIKMKQQYRITVEFPDGSTYEAVRSIRLMNLDPFKLSDFCDNCALRDTCIVSHPYCFEVFGNLNYYFQKIYTNGKNDDTGIV